MESPISSSIINDAGRVAAIEDINAIAKPTRAEAAVPQSHVELEGKQTEEQLRRNHDTFYPLMANSPFGIYVVDNHFRLRQASAGSQKVFSNVQPLMGRDFAEVLRTVWPEPFASEAIARFRHTLATGEPYHSATTERRHDIAQTESYDWKIERIILPDGEFGVVCYFYDMTERQRAEATIRESERRFREMIDALPTAIYTTDAEGRITHFNPAAVKLSGRVPELGTDHWCVSWKLFWPDGTPMPHDECPMAVALKEGRLVRGTEAILERPDGTRIWFEPYPTPLRDVSGRIVGGINMLVDITERKQAEKASALLAAIVHSSDDAIVSKDLTGVITSWNEGAERLFGYSAEEAVGQSITILIPHDRLHEETMILDRLKRGERIEHFETVRVRKDGAVLDISLTISPVKDAAGRIIGASKVARDISERKQAEAALRRSEKLAATGQLASTIAHEINNPMQALTNLLALLTYKTDINTEARTIAEMALSELGRMAHITKQMLSFHRDTLVPVPLRISEVLEDALELWATKLKGRFRVERKYDSTEHIMGFPGEIRQVFVNLIGNALEAAREGQTLRVHVFSSQHWKQMRPGVRIVVADRGPGIRPEHLGRIFEPFFTTKNEKGTGLGLWVSKQTVERHGGHIRVRTSTRPGQSGTVFSVFLPSQEPKIPASMSDTAAVA